MKTIAQLRKDAWGKFKANFWSVMGVIMMVALLSMLITYLPNIFKINLTREIDTFMGIEVEGEIYTPLGWLWLFICSMISCVLGFGEAYFMLNLVKGEKKTVGDMFSIMGKQFAQIILASFLIMIFEILGYVFLIIPGILVSLGTSMYLYVAAENPKDSVMGIIKKSYKMMKGYKEQYLLYIISFMFWFVLIYGAFALIAGIILTFASVAVSYVVLAIFIISAIVLAGFMDVTWACFYNEIKKENNIEEVNVPEVAEVVAEEVESKVEE